MTIAKVTVNTSSTVPQVPSVNKPLQTHFQPYRHRRTYRHSGPCRIVTGGRSAPGGRTQLLGHNDPSVTTGCSSPRASAPLSASPVQPSSPLKAGAAMRSAGMTLHASSLLRDRTSPSGGTNCRPDCTYSISELGYSVSPAESVEGDHSRRRPSRAWPWQPALAGLLEVHARHGCLQLPSLIGRGMPEPQHLSCRAHRNRFVTR